MVLMTQSMSQRGIASATVIGHKNFLYIADCKAAAHQTRAQLAQAGGRYCFPLPNTGHTPSWLKSWVLNPPSPIGHKLKKSEKSQS